MATKEDIRTLLKLILAAWPKTKLSNDMLDLWHEMLEQHSGRNLVAALKEHMRHSEWPPSIAELHRRALALSDPQAAMSGDEAFAVARRACAAGAYVRERVRGVLRDTPVVFEALERFGGPSAMGAVTNVEVARGQFARCFNSILAQAVAKAGAEPPPNVVQLDRPTTGALPEDVRNRLRGVKAIA